MSNILNYYIKFLYQQFYWSLKYKTYSKHITMDTSDNLKLTKIICTIGPASNTKDSIVALLNAGMNIIRLNFSHGTYEDHEKIFKIIEDIRHNTDYVFGVALDTKGPELRAIMSDEMEIKKGDQIRFTSLQKENCIQIKDIDFKDLYVGYEFTLDDGLLKVEVLSIDDYILGEALNDHILKPNKSVNLPGIKLKLPYLSQKDKEDVLFGMKHGIDYVFASFVSKTNDIKDIKDLFEHENNTPLLIAKIESLDGMENINEIINATDGIMVARGDLGAEIPLEDILIAQKRITKKCKEQGKPVIIATQMLENMIKFPVPKRCEISDIGNSVLDFADCVMLSAESATGTNPIECVKMMTKIILASEKTQLLPNKSKRYYIPSIIERLSANPDVKTIVVVVSTISNVLKFYEKQKQIKPIIVVSNDHKILRRISLYRNLTPCLIESELLDKRVDSVNIFLQELTVFIKNKFKFKAGKKIIVYHDDENNTETINIIKLK